VEEQPKNREGGEGRREFGKKIFAGKLGTDYEKAIGSPGSLSDLITSTKINH